jgi:hypothetical protein
VLALLLDEEINFRIRLAGAKPVPAQRTERFVRTARFRMKRTGVM